MKDKLGCDNRECKMHRNELGHLIAHWKSKCRDIAQGKPKRITVGSSLHNGIVESYNERLKVEQARLCEANQRIRMLKEIVATQHAIIEKLQTEIPPSSPPAPPLAPP